MKICLLFALVAALVSAAVVYITAPKPFHYVPATDVNWMQVGASPGIEHSRHPAVTGDAVVPFRIHVADTVLDDLSHRLDTAILPSSPVSDVYGHSSWAGGVNAATLRRLVEHWRTKFDWRAQEARLNALPQFVTRIHGLGIHFVHAPGEASSASGRTCETRPLLLLHGWPGSIVEFTRIIPLLTACGSDGLSFDVVAPSMPGYTWSDAALRPGLDVTDIAAIHVQLMKRLGYSRFLVQGGDWGGEVARAVGTIAPSHVVGAHVNFMPTLPLPHVAFMSWVVPGLALSAEDQAMVLPVTQFIGHLLNHSGYLHEHATRPDTIGTALAASPVALAAWLLEKFQSWSDCGGDVEARFSMDELLTHIMAYWTTGCITTSIRLYREDLTDSDRWALRQSQIPVPFGYADFPGEVTRMPRAWLEPFAPQLVHYSQLPRGGHFAAAEEPELLAADVRAFAATVESRFGGRAVWETSSEEANAGVGEEL